MDINFLNLQMLIYLGRFIIMWNLPTLFTLKIYLSFIHSFFHLFIHLIHNIDIFLYITRQGAKDGRKRKQRSQDRTWLCSGAGLGMHSYRYIWNGEERWLALISTGALPLTLREGKWLSGGCVSPSVPKDLFISYSIKTSASFHPRS